MRISFCVDFWCGVEGHDCASSMIDPLGIALPAAAGLVALLLVALPLMGVRRDTHVPPAESSRNTPCQVVCGCAHDASFDVVIVIDALRPDVWANRTLFPYVATLRDSGYVWEHRFLASAPTVTLPRLEAIVSGREGAFLDVIRNVAQGTSFSGQAVRCGDPAAYDDVLHALSCIREGHHRNRRIAFFGDDTWLRMFPQGHSDRTANVFIEAHGVASFDVHDSSRVDDTVTTHLQRFLAAADASDRTLPDLAWLHYLGYDHIGHVEDPSSSPRAMTKLHEMDHIVSSTLHQLCAVHSSSSVIVLSDHGMAIGGGHGGASQPERSVFLARIGCTEIGDEVRHLEGREASITGKEWPQVDVSQYLLRALSRKDVGDACPVSCVLPNSRGVLSPSFDAVVCNTTQEAALEEFRRQKEQQVLEESNQNSLSRMQLAWCSAILLGCVLVQFRHILRACAHAPEALAFITWTVVDGFLLKLSSSFVEESLYINWSVLGASAALAIALGRPSPSSVHTTRLLGACGMLRIAALSLFPIGVKWKTFASMEHVTPWRWITMSQWLRLNLSVHAPSESTSILRVALDSGCSALLVGAAVVGFFCFVTSFRFRATFVCTLACCTVPLTQYLYWVALMVMMSASAVYVKFLFGRMKCGLIFAMIALYLGEAGHGALGRSILISDVTFSHLVGGTVSEGPEMPIVGSVSVILWMHMGRIAVYTVLVHAVPRRMLSVVRMAAVVRSSLALCYGCAISLLMEGHLFYWSVFLPHLLFLCIHVVVEISFWAIVQV